MRQRSLANEAERNELVGELDESMSRLGAEAREATAALQHSHQNELRLVRDQHAEDMRVAREQMRNEITAEVRRDLAREKVS